MTARAYWIPFIATLLLGCQTLEPIQPTEQEIQVRVWPSDGMNYTFAERQDSDLYEKVTGKVGVCFSGGGTRSLSATAGQLRGLTQVSQMPFEKTLNLVFFCRF